MGLKEMFDLTMYSTHFVLRLYDIGKYGFHSLMTIYRFISSLTELSYFHIPSHLYLQQ